MKYYIVRVIYDANHDAMDHSKIVREFSQEELDAAPNKGMIELYALRDTYPTRKYVWTPADEITEFYVRAWEAK